MQKLLNIFFCIWCHSKEHPSRYCPVRTAEVNRIVERVLGR